MSRTNKWIDQGYSIQHKNDFYFYLLVISNTIKNNILKKALPLNLMKKYAQTMYWKIENIA